VRERPRHARFNPFSLIRIARFRAAHFAVGMSSSLRTVVLVAVFFSAGAVRAFAEEARPACADAHRQGPLSATETRVFMRELAQYVFDHHLKRDANSPQRGMVYEYFNTRRAGQHDQWIQGEALDTMHDGAWFAAALATAHRATGDPFYKGFLAQWVLPFYLKMLNHSDELFSPDNNNAAPDAPAFDREDLLQKGEKGFVPYFWDDGASISLEMAVKKRSLLFYRGFDEYTQRGEANPHYKLRGYSHGSSNHLAQDLGVMLEVAWLLLKDSAEPADKKLTAEIAGAARNLHECRMRHHGHIPAVCAAYGLSNGLAEELRRIPDGEGAANWRPANHYVTALRDHKPGQRCAMPGFADDQEYTYYSGIARHGTLPRPLAFKVIYDAFTAPMLYRIYSDDAEVPPGINRFDLHPFYFKDGKPEDFRSDRRGPSKGPRPAGSRMGPQNMVASGWALQAMRAFPDVWTTTNAANHPQKFFPQNSSPAQVTAALERELGAGLRTWAAIFKEKGYIPTGIAAGGMGAGYTWEDMSDAGGCAHLIKAGAEWLLHLEGKRDWEMQRLPGVK
jgi:hypothetical protein